MTNADPRDQPERALWRHFPPKDPGAEGFGSSKRDGHFFDLTTEDGRLLVTKVNMAIALSRPLLLTGAAGAGKSSIAIGIAGVLEWELLPPVIVTSRSDAVDLIARYDHVARLADATAQRLKDNEQAYVRLGPLCLAMAPEESRAFLDSLGAAPLAPITTVPRVLLIDEVDKGDLDFANNLLDLLEGEDFEVAAAGRRFRRSDGLLTVITSNGEQEFSEAFIRRCITHEVKFPDVTGALRFAQARQRAKEGPTLSDDRLTNLANLYAFGDPVRVRTSLFLDLVDAARKLGDLDNNTWERVYRAFEGFARSRSIRDGS